MTVFLGALGMLLGLLVMLAGAITFVRGLPRGVTLRPGRENPRGNWGYLLNQQALGLGVLLLALDVVLRLATRPFLIPGILCVFVPVVMAAVKRWRVRRGQPPAAR